MSATEPRRRWIDAAATVAPYLVGCCLVLAAFVTLQGSFQPTGDVAVIALRSADTMGPDLPLVGMPSTAGEGLHHPGPLQLWASGIVGAVVGGRLGVLVTTTVVHLAAIVTIVSVGRRSGGAVGAASAAVACFLVSWSLYGPELVSPLNPNAALFPLGAAVVAGVAAAVRPSRATLAAAVVFGSYAAQAHLVFAALVLVTAVPLAVLAWRRSSPDERRSRTALVAVLALLAWIGPIVDAVRNGGGNLRIAVDVLVSDSGERALGIGRAASVVAGALAPAPVFLQRDLSGAEVFRGASTPLTVVVSLALVVLVVAAGRSRAAHPFRFVASVTTGVLAVASVVAIGSFPSFALNAFARHNYLPLWLVSVAVWGLVVERVIHLLPAWKPATPATIGALSAAALAAFVVLPSPPVPADMAYVSSLAEQLDDELASGPHLVDVHADLRLFGIDAGLVRSLEDAGHDVRVPESVAASFGEHRVATSPMPTLVVDLGPPVAGDAPVVAEHRPDDSLVRRREAAADAVVAAVTAEPELLRDFRDEASDPAGLERFVREDLPTLVDEGFVVGPLPGLDATEALVETSREPWRTVRVVRATAGRPAS